ncbi:anti-sigma factor [Streptomyces globisporus]|uniref:anti-sigma factor n=1 Tax=Streptomyces globisporus TaxID=1908 RepID=UPI0034612EBF|nr:anti-sigma factor [Streptomyces globisporus]
MPHSDLDELAMLALGDVPPPSVAAHVLDCTECAAELADLRRVLDVGRSAAEPRELVEPPPEVWSGICAELGLSSQGADSPTLDEDSPAYGSRPSSQEDVSIVADGKAGDDGSRRRRWRSALALAAAAALLGAAAGSGLTWWAVDRQEPSTVAGTSRSLDPLLPSALGSARMGDAAGQRKLDIKVKGLPKTTGYFEVWLMDRSHKKLISMGVLGSDGHAVLPVPDNVDLVEYPIVDVSVQEFNGSPEHSGNSVVRGAFAST